MQGWLHISWKKFWANWIIAWVSRMAKNALLMDYAGCDSQSCLTEFLFLVLNISRQEHIKHHLASAIVDFRSFLHCSQRRFIVAVLFLSIITTQYSLVRRALFFRTVPSHYPNVSLYIWFFEPDTIRFAQRRCLDLRTILDCSSFLRDIMMENIESARRHRGIIRRRLTHIERNFTSLERKEELVHPDQWKVERLLGQVKEIDANFETRHLEVLDLIEEGYEDTLKQEEEVFDEHFNKVVELVEDQNKWIFQGR